MSQATIANITKAVLDAVLHANNSEDQSEANIELIAETLSRLTECSVEQSNVSNLQQGFWI